MGHHLIEFDEPVSQTKQGHTSIAFRCIAAGDTDQPGFAFTIEFSCAVTAAFLSLQCTAQPLSDTTFAYLFNRALCKTGVFGGIFIDKRRSLLAFINQQQDLCMPSAIGRFSSPIDESFKLFSLFR
jgi:hypothetical protein